MPNSHSLRETWVQSNRRPWVSLLDHHLSWASPWLLPLGAVTCTKPRRWEPWRLHPGMPQALWDTEYHIPIDCGTLDSDPFKRCGILWVKLQDRTPLLPIESAKTSTCYCLSCCACHWWPQRGEGIYSSPLHLRSLPPRTCVSLTDVEPKVLICKQNIGAHTVQVRQQNFAVCLASSWWSIALSPLHRSQCV